MKCFLFIIIFFLTIKLNGQICGGMQLSDSLQKDWEKKSLPYFSDSSKSILQIIPCDNYKSNFISDESTFLYAKYTVINSNNDTIKKTDELGELLIRLEPGKYIISMAWFDFYYFQERIEIKQSTFTKINMVFDSATKVILNKNITTVHYSVIDFKKYVRNWTLESSIK